MTEKVIAIVSGGLDSTTLVYDLKQGGFVVECVSFDYGQRHRKELRFAQSTARQLNLRHDVVDLTGLTNLISNSALTSGDRHNPHCSNCGNTRGGHFGHETSECTWDNRFEAAKAAGMLVTDEMLATKTPAIEVPDGHYAEETMKATVVPNRNMIMLSIGIGIAVNRGAQYVATAVHAGDHFIYPDCRPEFIQAVSKAGWEGNVGFGGFVSRDSVVIAPFVHATKEDIALKAFQLGVPLHLTWSCYKGGQNHCGRCGTCVERLEAIDGAYKRFQPEGHWKDFRDQTVYDDTEFWRTATMKEASPQ